MTNDLEGYYEDRDLVDWSSCSLTLQRETEPRFELREESWGDCGGTIQTLTGSYANAGGALILHADQLEVHETDGTLGIDKVETKPRREEIHVQVLHAPTLGLRFRRETDRILLQRPWGGYIGPFRSLGGTLHRVLPWSRYSFGPRSKAAFHPNERPPLEGTYELSAEGIHLTWKDGTRQAGKFRQGWISLGDDGYFPEPPVDLKLDGTYRLVKSDPTDSASIISFASDGTFVEKRLLAQLRQGREADRLDPLEGHGAYSIRIGWIDLCYEGRMPERWEFHSLYPGPRASQPKAIMIRDAFLKRQ